MARPEDAAGCLAIYAPVVRDTAISFELEPPGEEELRRRIEATLPGKPWIVAHAGDEAVGYACASTFRERPAYRWTVEASVVVAPEHRGHGTGRALLELLLACLREQGFRTAIGVVALPNPASIRLIESLGFRAVGTLHGVGFKHGAWRDTGWWELDLAGADARPAPLRDAEEAFAAVGRGKARER